MNERNEFGAGWALPVLGVGTGGGAKAHYYTAGIHGQSLCGKYAMLGGEREDTMHESPDNCRACMTKLAALRPDLGIKLTPRLRVEVTETINVDGWTYLRKGWRGFVEMEYDALERASAAGLTVAVHQGRPPSRKTVRVDASLLRPLTKKAEMSA